MENKEKLPKWARVLNKIFDVVGPMVYIATILSVIVMIITNIKSWRLVSMVSGGLLFLIVMIDKAINEPTEYEKDLKREQG